MTHYLNADEIAKEFKVADNKTAGIKAERLFLSRLNKISRGNENFALETTLSIASVYTTKPKTQSWFLNSIMAK